eukprot:jgi/Picsp_1/1020/NSC_04504-R1_---NA---
MFGLAVWPNNGIGLYNRIIQMIKILGADYHVWIGSENDFQRRKEGYINMLWALKHFPLQDWIIIVNQDELVDFGVHNIHDYFDNCERNGANYARVYDKTDSVSKMFATRGYLRCDETCSRVFDIEQAEEYFERELFSDFQASESLRNSIFSFTPYDRWWEFYKSSTMVGNAYLWYARDGCDGATHAFSNSSETNHIIETCSIAALLALKYFSIS